MLFVCRRISYISKNM